MIEHRVRDVYHEWFEQVAEFGDTPFNNEVFNVFYNKEENTFYDPFGLEISNIFELITPNDLFLFRKDHKKCCFRMRFAPYALCRIVGDDHWDV